MLADTRVHATSGSITLDVRGLSQYNVVVSGNLGQNTAGGNQLDVVPVWGLASGGLINVKAFGANTGTADNSAIIERAYASSPGTIRFDEFYPITGNFGRDDIPHTGTGGVTISGNNIELSTERLREDVTVYVSNGGSDSDNHGLSSAHPFATPGKALSMAASRIYPGVTYLVEMADGTYDTGYIDASDTERDAVVYFTGVLSDRSAATGGNLVGGVVLKGATKAGTKIKTGSTWDYGVYVTRGANLGIQDLTIEVTSGTSANAMLTSHRGAYIQTLNVDIAGGTDAAQCAVAESGGSLELTGNGALTGAGTGLVVLDESHATIANTVSISGASSSAISGRGTIQIANTVSISGAISIEGANLIFRGTDGSNPMSISSSLTAYSCKILCTFAEISGQWITYGCDIDLNACEFSNSIFLRGGEINLMGNTKTYISPATASTVTDPIILQGNAIYKASSGVLYNGSGGRTGPKRQRQNLSVTGNDQSVSLNGYDGPHQTISVSSNGAHTGLLLPTTYSDWGVAPASGDRVTLRFGGANSVGLSTTAPDIDGASFTLGKGAGQYGAITLEWFDTIWKEISRSGVN